MDTIWALSMRMVTRELLWKADDGMACLGAQSGSSRDQTKPHNLQHLHIFYYEPRLAIFQWSAILENRFSIKFPGKLSSPPEMSCIEYLSFLSIEWSYAKTTLIPVSSKVLISLAHSLVLYTVAHSSTSLLSEHQKLLDQKQNSEANFQQIML